MITNTAKTSRPNYPSVPQAAGNSHDRLGAVTNFANELNDSRLWKIKISYQKRWTKAKRDGQAVKITHSAPWTHSSGPKTARGKAISAANATRHGFRAREWRDFYKLMSAHSLYCRMLQTRAELRCATDPVVIERHTMLLEELLVKMRLKLAAAGVETPALDSRILLRQGGGFSDADLITRAKTPLSSEVIEKTEQFISRRLAGEPVSRILGGREFWGLDFIISKDTLDPRADTETLVAAALKTLSGQAQNPLKILDLGTGSGCILIALLKELPHALGVGVDLNPGAIDVARRNAALHGVDSRLEFRVGSWFEPLKPAETFDLIVSNPPYIPKADIESLARDVREYDPVMALTDGKDGLSAYKTILKDLKKHLECGGSALFEIGAGQEKDLARLVEESSMNHIESYTDLAGIIRVLEMSVGKSE